MAENKTASRKNELLRLFDAAVARAPAPLARDEAGALACWNKRLARLFKLRHRYLNYLSARMGIFPKREARAATFWGKGVRLPLKDYAALMIYSCGILGPGEWRLTKFFIKNFRPEDVFYDVGASLGFYTWLAQELITEGEIHCFEPLPSAFGYLKANTAPSPKLFLSQTALSDSSGAACFYDAGSGGDSTLSSMSSAAAGVKARSIDIQTLTLDDYVKTHRAPTIMKLDAEGWEDHILAGGVKTLKENGPTIVMEVWPERAGLKYPARAVEQLKNAGYRPFAIDSEGGLAAAEPSPRALMSEHGWNFIFKK